MKNTLLWGIIILVLIGGAYWAFANKSNKPATGTNQTQTNTGQKTSIKSLMAAGRPVTCKYTQDSNTGMVYISGNKMRGDFMADGTNGHMINDGSFIYFWTDGTTQGFKMSADTTASTNTNPAASQAPDVNAEQDLDCSPWSINAASFTPPAGVTFTALPGASATGTTSTKIPSTSGYGY